jgi:N-acetylmuramoyl-L-alanine amidase
MSVGASVLRWCNFCITFLCTPVFLTLFLVLSFPVRSLAQESAKLVINGDISRTLSIAAVERNGILYGSLTDIAGKLNVRAVPNPKLKSIDLTRQAIVVTLFSDNTFCTIANGAGPKATFQLPTHGIAFNNDLYIPLAAFTPFFERFFGNPAMFDSTTRTLRISKPIAAVPDLPGVTLETRANGMFIRVKATKPLRDVEHFLKADGWLYVTIPNAKADVRAIDKTKPAGFVKKILATQFPSSAQLAFKLEGNYSTSEIVKDDTSHDLLITIRSRAEAVRSAIEERRRTQFEEQRKKHELDVIVLDAGHGGKDPGTIGVTGTYEKNVALGIVLKLGKLIKKNLKSVDVVYTRDSDRFIELDRRGQIANEADGKLFISVHCNAMPRKPYPKRGFEVYLLRPGRTDEAISIAERENSVIELEEGYEQRYRRLTDENFILVTMAQTAHMKASEMFAEFASKEMDNVLEIPNNGVTQAGFYVLVGSAMPNVLIETAYLSNREDEKLLKSESGQEKYAEALFNAIKRYKVEYEKLLKEGNGLGDKRE